MDKLRLRFEKTGRAVWISHLDLMHTMQRAFSRAGYALKYSEGFNPHPVISILLLHILGLFVPQYSQSPCSFSGAPQFRQFFACSPIVSSPQNG